MKTLQEWAAEASAPRLTTEQKLGKAIAGARRGAGWTQTDFAILIRRRGVKWSPAIVGLVERGERHLRFTEAVIVQRLLQPFGMDLEDLVDRVPVIPEDQEVEW